MAQPDEKFEKLNNRLIEYANKENHFFLAAYVFSKFMCNQYRQIGTTMELVTDMFFPDRDKRSRSLDKFKDAFTLLQQDIAFKQQDVDYTLLSCIDDASDFYAAGYKDALWFRLSEPDLANSYTSLKYCELEYLLSKSKELNATGSKVNSVDLLNVFLLLKMFCDLNTNNSKKYKGSSAITYFATDTLCSKLSMSSKTVSSYINYLVSIGMLQVKKGSFQNGKANEYTIVDTWMEERDAHAEADSNKQQALNIEENPKPEIEVTEINSKLKKITNFEKYRNHFNKLLRLATDMDRIMSNDFDLAIHSDNTIKTDRKALTFCEECYRHMIEYNLPAEDREQLADIPKILEQFEIILTAEEQKRQIA